MARVCDGTYGTTYKTLHRYADTKGRQQLDIQDTQVARRLLLISIGVGEESPSEETQSSVADNRKRNGRNLGVSNERARPDVTDLAHDRQRRGIGNVNILLGRKKEEKHSQKPRVLGLVRLRLLKLLNVEVGIHPLLSLCIRLQEQIGAERERRKDLGESRMKGDERGGLESSERHDKRWVCLLCGGVAGMGFRFADVSL